MLKDTLDKAHIISLIMTLSDVYTSEHVIRLVQKIRNSLFKFLHKCGHQMLLEDKFKSIHHFVQEVYYTDHNCDGLIVEECVRFFLFKFVKDQNTAKSTTGTSKGHAWLMKRFKF